MSLSINTNITSIAAQRSLSSNTTNLNKSMQKLSSGLRINQASDDAAGLTISEKFKSQYRGMDVAQSNAQDATNLLSNAEGDLSVIQDNLQRVRDLTVQAANDTNSTAEREAIQAEVTARISEIDRLAESSNFNGIKLLNGDNSAGLSFQIGANSDTDTNQIKATVFDSAKSSALGITTSAGAALGSASAAAAFLDEVDDAIKNVSTRRSDIGSLQNRLDSQVQSLSISSENLKAADSRVRDVDVAKESAKFAKSQILQQASLSILAQANQSPQMALKLI